PSYGRIRRGRGPPAFRHDLLARPVLRLRLVGRLGREGRFAARATDTFTNLFVLDIARSLTARADDPSTHAAGLLESASGPENDGSSAFMVRSAESSSKQLSPPRTRATFRQASRRVDPGGTKRPG